MGWNGTIIDGINTKIAGNATGSIQQALNSSQVSQAKLFEVEQGKDDRWARYRPVKSWQNANNADVVTIHARNGGTVNWKTAYGAGTVPGYIGDTTNFQKSISGTYYDFITFCGLDVPIVLSASNAVNRIYTNTGKTGFQWNKTEQGTWKYLRALDFDGYKPSASFPGYYSLGNGQIPYDSGEFYVGLGHQLRDDYRLFLGDLGRYAFNDNLYWAIFLRRTNGATQSTILYQDRNSNSFKMSYYNDTGGQYSGINLFSVPTAFYKDSQLIGTSWNVYALGYDPTRDIAVLLPSGGGETTTNPMTYTVINAAADPLQNLTFTLTSGNWGKATNNPTDWTKFVPFPSFSGGIFQDGYGLSTSSTFIFSITFSNTSGLPVTIQTSLIKFKFAIFDTVNMQQGSWGAAQSPAVYDASKQTVTSITVNNNSSGIYYFSIGNIWQGITPTGSASYADMVVMNIEYGSYPSTYPGGSAFFYATSAGTTYPKLICSVNYNTGKINITGSQNF